jgi:high-affinity iron transporter
MGAAFVITLRERIEAALIVSILLAYLRRLGRQDLSRVVWWGTVLAFVVSLGVGTIIFVVGAEFEGRAEEIFGGLVTLTAVAVLTWMIFWMRRQGARIKGELHEKVNLALWRPEVWRASWSARSSGSRSRSSWRCSCTAARST